MFRNPVLLRFLGALALLLAVRAGNAAEEAHDHHAGHRMQQDAGGMVMNANDSELPRDCDAISTDHEFEVRAGAAYADGKPGTTFGYSRRDFRVEPCSRVTVTLINEDEVRHQWMVHGLPRYLYPEGMFHIETAGGGTRSGTFIVPSDTVTYLVHCDMAQHMEKGLKGQLVVGSGSGDLWSVPGIGDAFYRNTYLANAWPWVLAGLYTGALVLALWLRKTRCP